MSYKECRKRLRKTGGKRRNLQREVVVMRRERGASEARSRERGPRSRNYSGGKGQGRKFRTSRNKASLSRQRGRAGGRRVGERERSEMTKGKGKRRIRGREEMTK